MARRFNESFENCAGKDCLQIIKERGDKDSHFSFLEPGVPTILLKSLPISSTVPVRSGPGERLEPVHRERTEKEMNAAKLIRKNWRRGCKRQEFFKTPYGRAISYIRRLCKEVVVERPPLHPREIMARRAALFDRGPSLYRYFEETKEKYYEVKRVLVIWTRKDAAGNQSVVQAFQRQLKTLSAMSELTQTAGTLNESNWENLRVSSGVLNEKITEALEALGAINARLEMITGKNLC